MRGAGSIMLGLVLALGAAPARAQSIFDAVKTGTPDQVQALAAKDASLVNVKDAAGKTPLHHAAIGGSVPMIECLLSLGAAIDAATTENLTPLLEAVRSGKDAAANALIEKGARIDGVLHWAARFNRTAVIETVDRQGRRHRGAGPAGIHAADVGRADGGGPFEAIELLVRKGANFNLPDSLGNTPLDNAIIYGSGDNRTIDLLLARSAAVNTEPAALASTLSAAARRGHVRLFDYYLARGGEALLATESNRRTVMRSATMGGSLEMVKALQARGIPLDLAPNRNGATPLHSLASNPKALDMIEFLVRNGADVNARTNDGRSAYNIADAAGNREVAALLLKLGASPEPAAVPTAHGPVPGADTACRRTQAVRTGHRLSGPRHRLRLAGRPGDVLADRNGDHDDPDPGRSLDETSLRAVQRAERDRLPRRCAVRDAGQQAPLLHVEAARRARSPAEGEHLVRRTDTDWLVGATVRRPGRERHEPALAGVGLERGDPVLRRTEREGRLRQRRHLLLPAGERRVHGAGQSGSGHQHEGRRVASVHRA